MVVYLAGRLHQARLRRGAALLAVHCILAERSEGGHEVRGHAGERTAQWDDGFELLKVQEILLGGQGRGDSLLLLGQTAIELQACTQDAGITHLSGLG